MNIKFWKKNTNKTANNSKSLRNAFTLAEILITLGIIGIIAAMTIPTIIQNIQVSVNVSALKKAYTTYSQAYTLAVEENGTPDNWDLVDDSNYTGEEKMLNELATYLKVTKNCGKNPGCLATPYTSLTGVLSDNDGNAGFAKAQLADGTFMRILVIDSTCNTSYGNSISLSNICANIMVDTNGFKAPNKWGVDAFIFHLTKYSMVPQGSALSSSGAYSFPDGCIGSTNPAGAACTAWVIYNENMDYLKPCGSTLSWSGLTKCN